MSVSRSKIDGASSGAGRAAIGGSEVLNELVVKKSVEGLTKKEDREKIEPVVVSSRRGFGWE